MPVASKPSRHEKISAEQPKKGGNNMTYKKPELTVVGTAIVVIQGGKNDVSKEDSQKRHSIPAYQADE